MRHIIIAVLGCFGISYSPFIVAQVPASEKSYVLDEIVVTAENPGWNVFNARIAVDIGTTWTVGLNARNIFDEDYYVDGSVWPCDAVPGTPAPNFDPVIGTLGQPRLLTVDLSASFWSDPRTFRNGETNR